MAERFPSGDDIAFGAPEIVTTATYFPYCQDDIALDGIRFLMVKESGSDEEILVRTGR